MTIARMAELIQKNSGMGREAALEVARRMKEHVLPVRSEAVDHTEEAGKGIDFSPAVSADVDSPYGGCYFIDAETKGAGRMIEDALESLNCAVVFFGSGAIMAQPGRPGYRLVRDLERHGIIVTLYTWKDGVAFIYGSNGYNFGSDGYVYDVMNRKKLIPYADFWDAE